MARTLYGHVEVGKKVYPSFRPLHAGVIQEVIPQPSRPVKHRNGTEVEYTPPPNVKVKWVDGTVTEVCTLTLSDFDALIEDHQKKLNTHLETKAKLEALNG